MRSAPLSLGNARGFFSLDFNNLQGGGLANVLHHRQKAVESRLVREVGAPAAEDQGLATDQEKRGELLISDVKHGPTTTRQGSDLPIADGVSNWS